MIFPDVENYVRFQGALDKKFVKTSDRTTQIPVAFADPQIFTVFSFKLLSGSPTNALAEPRNAVLTKSKAIDLFGTTDVLGKTLEIKIEDRFEPFTVVGVAENIPSNSSIRFDILLSFDYLQTTGFGKMAVNNWSFSGFQNYILLTHGSSLVNDPQRLSKFRKKYLPDEEAQLKQYGAWDGRSPYPVSFRLQPIRDIHTTLTIRDSPGRTHRHENCLDVIEYSNGNIIDRLHQFYNISYWSLCRKIKRNRAKKSPWSKQKKTNFSISRGITAS
jgi:putative ABC transport system permease protein